MAAQAALIADTITGMKRALRREREDNGPDDPIMAPTNRGTKMHANAKFVSEGALGYINGENFYKQKIEHAGYTRHILQQNPTRYDSEGDELDEEDEDSEADVAAAEENPFSGIALETLLCPLKHPSELPTHPSMSQPYTSQALEQMTQAVDLKLRQERALLWRARNLHRQFLGDGGWMPCSVMETPDDRWIFEPRIMGNDPSAAGQNGPSRPITPYATETSAPQDIAQQSSENRAQDEAQPQSTNDVEMAEAPETEANKPDPQLKSEETDAMVKDLPPHNDLQENDQAEADNENQDMGTPKDDEPEDGEDQEMHDDSSPEPLRRMTTRAQANADTDGSPVSSAGSTSTLPTPHPLFLVPENVRPDANFGLPPAEAEETRRLLWSYIQKQEETVRGFEHMLDSLIKSARMKSDVLEWCKAEGHVGEMSDGEDWYDREKWGLADGEDLKKGTDEDEIETVDESRTQAKRGRGRRQ
ncbi:unnamed protein product [Penicillium salamii]|uniref:Transcriptional regulatory protein RXT2 N-terminal domain-containing protein n=1 Tax=Penicillium salamii TaxID=1612424 RepID=A0A9W4K556_9EURO|nr:unnamed protein product [Penicillium salamii]CAG8198152.1 unnamed protein product [Penicillium salamii]CAG8320405.1 unnamed protein product [Penicillium salamii]CAG8329242.1 unnamed protein product [Penicillium salamii]CAG8338589.1 unnamed protein product [Penicillium salamii]